VRVKSKFCGSAAKPTDNVSGPELTDAVEPAEQPASTSSTSAKAPFRTLT
jgi:hypothetical protein